MATFDEFSAALGNGAKSLASTTFADFQGQAEADAAVFIAKMEADLRRWTRLLSRRSITGEDFRDLLLAKKALVESGERVYEDGDQGDEPIAGYGCTAVDDDHDEADETDTGVHPKGLRTARTLVRCRLGRAALLGWGLWCEPSTTAVARDSAQSAAYRQGITDACVAESGEVVGGLIPITRETPGLVWSDQGELLVVAWKNPSSYKNELADKNETGLDTNKLLWVTPAPQVQHYCQAAVRADTELGQDGLALRLTQFLGLPPYRHYGLFIELWVKPHDLFRACADPETSDDRCELVAGPIPARRGLFAI